MSSVSAVRRINFCAGHRIHGHENKCRHFHGHNFQVYFHASCEKRQLDTIGRVVDFGVLKERLGGWIEEHWDHGFLIWENDREAVAVLQQLPEQKLYLMPDNPTAENIALFLLNHIAPSLLDDTPITIDKVVVWETENCFAEVQLHERSKSDQAARVFA